MRRVDIDFYSADAVRDPWPHVDRLRAAGPLVWNGAISQWVVTTDRLCRRILLDPVTFSLTEVTAPFFGEGAFIAIDEKDRHDELRGVWSVAFQRGTLERLEAVVAAFADRLLSPIGDRLRAGAIVDLASAFCRDLPAYVIAHMLGVPPDMQAKIVEWSDLMGAGGGVPNAERNQNRAWLASEGAKAELAAYLFEQIEDRRRRPGDDLISQIVHSDVGRRLSDESIMQNTRQLLFAGNETTAKWLGHIIVTLARHPETRRILIQSPDLVAPAVEEVMRWEPVVQRIPRIVTAQTEVEGQQLRAGDQLLLLIGAANRDAERYDRPEVFDISRAPKAHLGFGYGMHSCLGVTLARLEARVATLRFLAQAPECDLAGPVEYGAFGLRGPTRIPMAIPR